MRILPEVSFAITVTDSMAWADDSLPIVKDGQEKREQVEKRSDTFLKGGSAKMRFSSPEFSNLFAFGELSPPREIQRISGTLVLGIFLRFQRAPRPRSNRQFFATGFWLLSFAQQSLQTIFSLITKCCSNLGIVFPQILHFSILLLNRPRFSTGASLGVLSAETFGTVVVGCGCPPVGPATVAVSEQRN